MAGPECNIPNSGSSDKEAHCRLVTPAGTQHHLISSRSAQGQAPSIESFDGQSWLLYDNMRRPSRVFLATVEVALVRSAQDAVRRTRRVL